MVDARRSALAISTSCRSPSESRSTGVRGSTGDGKNSLSRREVSRAIAARSTRPARVGKAPTPMCTFSAIERFGNRLNSWWIAAIPKERASSGVSCE